MEKNNKCKHEENGEGLLGCYSSCPKPNSQEKGLCHCHCNISKLILPKPHLSWSALSCWLSSPDRFRREYFECGEKLSTSYLRFGAGIHKMIEDGTHKDILPDLFVYEVSEFEIKTSINGVPILSYIDSYDPVNNVFSEVKTGKIPWTRAKVIKHGQLVFYATALKHSVGRIPEYCDLQWIETRDAPKTVETGLQNDSIINVTGRVLSFHREFDEREIEAMEEKIVRVAEQISDAYQEFLKEI